MTSPGGKAAALCRRLGRLALGLGLALAALVAVGWIRDPDQFRRSYLVAFLFALCPAGGALGLLLLHRLTGGRWGEAILEILTAAASTLPYFALLFVPVLLGLEAIFPWAAPGWQQSDAATAHKALYLDERFFIARAAVYFIAWSWMALAVSRRPAPGGHPGLLGGPGLLAYVLTTSMAGIDWGMSLGPDWYSTMYGLTVILGQALSALTLAVILRYALDRAAPENALPVDVYHDLGTLLFALVLMWAYVGFSQFLIIWSGNLPEEVTWYMERLAPGWKILASGLVLIHFAMPFVLLMMRQVKRKPAYLATVCAVLFAAHLGELLWLILPAYYPDRLRIHWLDIILPLALFFLWAWLFCFHLHRRLAMPTAHSPKLEVSTAP